ncbi:hydantoinase/oxoprolinase family protein [Methanohalophilus halophilus]|uniref:Hydantoinase n=1 Tax=Methanohalophilus halophilus TaxID=2177 RepID=A0A1L3Q0Q9_9EURY|nr:hydantoinase/oxoprolinase family protein [Methanohalophilus halophilus]APH38464.1 hydantoinase [Methanohalophilus halophilus]RNI10659.1 hydantoinase/oxoprolinase family protein [Methanohalophilus halophilus]SDW09316.1 N-methylhydantoinase A/oxoprolinase/acetone carboxylase, beta subunit [Methanohalophilus halophilus]
MVYSLGIDAGGTYTDSVLLDDDTDSILDSNKALTTYPDPLNGIKNSIDGLDQEKLKKVKIVSVSTTLSTNTILEGTGFPVGLFLIGNYDLKEKLPTPHYVKVAGGHTYNGGEKEPLDEEAVRDFAVKIKDKVAAFAISSFFSIRNPDHEIRAKQIIREATGLPVVCAHELSQDLGAFERATTAFFNAQLLPITERFMSTVEKDVTSRGISPKIFMLKCDGSVIGIKSALEKPIESIFSGPAGSLVGASFLTGNDSCAVIDVGGTSTDISVIKDGVPEMSEMGAVVGGWKTRVKAIKMETSAMGGDSHIWVKDGKLNVGPRRVIPLCRAADLYPDFLELLKINPMPTKTLIGMNFQPTTFFTRTEYEAMGLNDLEQELLDSISSSPTSLRELRSRMGRYPSTRILDSLIQKRLVQCIGFTPTDALHVLGDYTARNVEAAEVGAEYLGSLCKRTGEEFARYVKETFAKNMASDLISFFLEGIPREEIRKIFDIDCPTKFKVDIPVVLIGGPVVAYKDILGNIIDAEIIVPKYSDVGNATGALAAKGVRRVDFLIRPASMAAPDWEYYVFSEKGRQSFYEYKDAIKYARETGQSMVMQYMEDAGLDPDHVEIDVKKDEIVPEGWDFPMETKIRIMGVGTRLIDEEA